MDQGNGKQVEEKSADDLAWDAVMQDPANKEAMADIAREIKEQAARGELGPFEKMPGAAGEGQGQ